MSFDYRVLFLESPPLFDITEQEIEECYQEMIEAQASYDAALYQEMLEDSWEFDGADKEGFNFVNLGTLEVRTVTKKYLDSLFIKEE